MSDDDMPNAAHVNIVSDNDIVVDEEIEKEDEEKEAEFEEFLSFQTDDDDDDDDDDLARDKQRYDSRTSEDFNELVDIVIMSSLIRIMIVRKINM